MKKCVLLLAMLLALTGCKVFDWSGSPEVGDPPVPKGTGSVNVPDPNDPIPLSDKTEDEAAVHRHALSEEDHTLDHEPAYYCGNTVTTVSCATWEASFWGSDSVDLTDLLLHLDYSGDVCRCLPEYTVDTEFGAGYGVNLTEGYARHDGGQVSLTAEQVENIRGILERQSQN